MSKSLQFRKVYTVPLIIIVFIIATSGIIRHDKDIQRYIDVGASSEFDCVGRYTTIRDSSNYAAGVLISSNWVLTASHFVEDSSLWKFKNHFYRTKRIVKHPKLVSGSSELQWTGWDLALIELESPVIDVIPANRYRGSGEKGQVISKIGYGFVGNGKLGMAAPRFQQRLGGKNVIDAIGGNFEGREFTTDVMVCDFDSPETDTLNRFGSAKPLDLEIGGSKGDSGGGIFMNNNGRQELVGIVSGALNRQIKYGSVMALARVSRANHWIDTITRKRK